MGCRFGGEDGAWGRQVTKARDRVTQAMPGAPSLGSIGSPALYDRGYGLGQNLEIEPQGPVVDILHIQLHPFLKGQG
jgi:hypothetical protein